MQVPGESSETVFYRYYFLGKKIVKMKRLIILATAMIIAAVAHCENIVTESFESVCVNIPADVRIQRGEDYGVRIVARNKYVTRTIKTRVENGVLKIDARDLESLQVNEKIRLYITVPSDCQVKVGRDTVIASEKRKSLDSVDIAMN